MKRAVLFIGAAVYLVMGSLLSAQQLTIHCLDIGYGDCTLIVSPTGETVLIDAGPPFNASEEHLYEYLDGLGITQLDYIIVTHYHRDHLGGVASLVDSGLTIGAVFDRGWYYCKTDYTDKYIPAIGSIRNTLTDGQIFDLGGGVTATVVSINGNGELSEPFVDRECTDDPSDDENDYSVALLVSYGDFDFYVGGDLTGDNDGGYADIETSVAPEVGEVEVYQVNHHGSKYSTNPYFLETLSPSVSVLSVGSNGYGHPDTSVVRRLQEISTLYQTADSDGNPIDGDIVIETDGSGSFTVNGDLYWPPTPPNHYVLQNFEDDVDATRGCRNCFGGTQDTISGDPSNPVIAFSCDTMNTRRGYGRCLKIDYGPLDNWTMYIESLKRVWNDFATSFNLTDLYPDFQSSEFQNRHIDSILFYYKLVASNTLTLRFELKDSLDRCSAIEFDIEPGDIWQPKVIALTDLSGDCDFSCAKFLGLKFDATLDNVGEDGTLYVDDFCLVETDFTKPSFADDAELLDYLNQVNFRHFWMAVDPVSKFALDRHTWSDLISVDAIGFQLASYVIAHKNGWIEPSLVEERVEHILTYLLYECEHATDSATVAADPLKYATMNGIWAHFLDYQTLGRKDILTEFSVFTNALLLSGVVVCGEYFSSIDTIASMADSLYRMADWNFLYVADSNIMHYCWAPESGRSPYWSDWFTEELDLAFLLAMSSPAIEHRIADNPFWSEYYNQPECNDFSPASFVYSAPGANFTYYFMQMYARYLPINNVDTIGRFENAQNALLADVAFCNSQYCSAFDYDSRIFGTTACEGPDSASTEASNYHAYGYPCRLDETNDPNGTVAVYGSGSAVLFIPDEATACLRYYYDELDHTFLETYGYGFWSPIFGFPDAFHLAPDCCDDTLVNKLCFRGPWLSLPRLGIDVGPMLLNIDSYLSEEAGELSVRDYFSQNVDIAPNLPDFQPLIVSVEELQTYLPSRFHLWVNYPNPFNANTRIRFELPARGHVYLEVVNILGQRVSVLADGEFASGRHQIEWDGTDGDGRLVATGVYFCRLKSDDFVATRKMMLLK